MNEWMDMWKIFTQRWLTPNNIKKDCRLFKNNSKKGGYQIANLWKMNNAE